MTNYMSLTLNFTVTFFENVNSKSFIKNGDINKSSFFLDTNINKRVETDLLLELYVT